MSGDALALLGYCAGSISVLIGIIVGLFLGKVWLTR